MLGMHRAAVGNGAPAARLADMPNGAAFEDAASTGDEYDREAITWVMACTAHLPGAFFSGSRDGPAIGE
jgi:hypothetical protein